MTEDMQGVGKSLSHKAIRMLKQQSREWFNKSNELAAGLPKAHLSSVNFPFFVTTYIEEL